MECVILNRHKLDILSNKKISLVYGNVIFIHKLLTVGGVFFLNKVKFVALSLFFLSGYYYFVFGKILFFHFISSYCECFETRLEAVEENKTLVGSGSGNCFHFTPNGNATSISQHRVQKQNESHAVAYYK